MSLCILFIENTFALLTGNRNMKMTNFKFNILFAIILILSITAGCKHAPLGGFINEPGFIPDTDSTITIIEDECDPDSVYFENDVLPILVSNCAISGCHDPETHKEGIIFSTFSDVVESDVIDIDDPYDSEMLEAILEDDLEDRMPPPPYAPLSSEEINILVRWMEQGAENNSCEECDTTAVTYSGTVADIIGSYCLGCHGGSSPSGGIGLSTYSGVAEVAASGQLEGSLNGYSGFTQMPLGSSPLPDCKIDAIVTWIENGYPDN